MLSFEDMTIRFLVALALGALMGAERELIHKEAGVRTAMLVAGGSALFTIASLIIPFVTDVSGVNETGGIPDRIAANIVVGIGFLGAGIIIKTGTHIHGLTTAALVWTVASIGMLAGLGLISFAVFAALVVSGLLFLFRKINVNRAFRHNQPME